MCGYIVIYAGHDEIWHARVYHGPALTHQSAQSPTPSKLGMVIEVTRTILALPNRVCIKRIVLLLGRAEKFGGNATPKLKPS